MVRNRFEVLAIALKRRRGECTENGGFVSALPTLALPEKALTELGS